MSLYKFGKKTVEIEKPDVIKENQKHHEEHKNKVTSLIGTPEFKALDKGDYLKKPQIILDALLKLEGMRSSPVDYAFAVSKLLTEYKTIRDIVRKYA